MRKIFLMAAAVITIASCGGKGKTPGIDKSVKEAYDRADSCLSVLIQQFDEVKDTPTVENVTDLAVMAKDLSYDFSPLGLDSLSVSYCSALKNKVEDTKKEIIGDIDNIASRIKISAFHNEELLVEDKQIIPFYLSKGDSLQYSIKMQSPTTIRFYNADSKTLIKSFAGKTVAQDNIVAPNSAIYLFEITPGKAQYADIDINYYVKNFESLKNLKKVTFEKKSCGPKDFLVSSVKGIKTTPLFNEPRKFTLRSQFKSMFSGSSRALVAVTVPRGATDILYNLRISTSEGDRSEDGKFDENLNISYKKVRFIGLPLYESQKGSGLIAMLLDDNHPLRDEDAYCNMYVFTNSTLAKKFQDNTPASTLNYNVDYSTLGTQSCNGRIPTSIGSKIYLAFENERVRYSNYIWIEVSAIVPTTEYYNYDFRKEDL